MSATVTALNTTLTVEAAITDEAQLQQVIKAINFDLRCGFGDMGYLAELLGDAAYLADRIAERNTIGA